MNAEEKANKPFQIGVTDYFNGTTFADTRATRFTFTAGLGLKDERSHRDRRL